MNEPLTKEDVICNDLMNYIDKKGNLVRTEVVRKSKVLSAKKFLKKKIEEEDYLVEEECFNDNGILSNKICGELTTTKLIELIDEAFNIE